MSLPSPLGMVCLTQKSSCGYTSRNQAVFAFLLIYLSFHEIYLAQEHGGAGETVGMKGAEVHTLVVYPPQRGWERLARLGQQKCVSVPDFCGCFAWTAPPPAHCYPQVRLQFCCVCEVIRSRV